MQFLKILPCSNGHEFEEHWTTVDKDLSKMEKYTLIHGMCMNFFFGFNNAQFVRKLVQAVRVFQTSSPGLYLNRPKPSLSRLHHKYQLSKLQEEERRPNQVERTLTQLQPPAVSAGCSLGSFCRSFICKVPRLCTRERTQSTCTFSASENSVLLFSL